MKDWTREGIIRTIDCVEYTIEYDWNAKTREYDNVMLFHAGVDLTDHLDESLKDKAKDLILESYE